MADIDFQAILDGMAAGSSGSDPIKSIYDILPTYDQTQQLILFQATYYIEKYDLQDMRAIFDLCGKLMGQNKNLGLLSTKNLKDLLAAYTQNEYLRGIKVSKNIESSDVTSQEVFYARCNIRYLWPAAFW